MRKGRVTSNSDVMFTAFALAPAVMQARTPVVVETTGELKAALALSAPE